MKSSVYPFVGVRLDRKVEWPMAPIHCPREAAHDSFTRAVSDALFVESLGFDWVSVSEHHFMPGMMTPNAVVLAGALAQATKTIKIALLGPILPLNNPVRVAEEIAMLDAIAGGRVVCMALRGTPNEVLSYTINPDEAREMTQEGIDLMVRAWTEPEPFAWSGRYYNYRNVALWPRTFQDPHPKCYGSGNSAESIVYAAERRMGIGVSYAPTPVVKKMVALYHEEAGKRGWTPTKDDVVYRTHIHVGKSQEQAEIAVPIADESPLLNVGRIQSAALNARLTPMHLKKFPLRPALFGGPQEVVDQFGALSEAGVGIVDMGFNWPGLPHEQQLRSMEHYAEHVMPAVRAL